MSDFQEQIDESLKALRVLIAQAVTAEQLRDPLTRLPNDSALTLEVNASIEKSRAFWIAFLEIDYFKRINDEFGYENADLLLKAVAQKLESDSKLFPDAPKTFRAHGDEFFMVGRLDSKASDDEMTSGINQIRGNIAGLLMHVSNVNKTMRCTVSVGWLRSDKIVKVAPSERDVRSYLELAVSEAKRQGRNKVVQYDDSLRKLGSFSIRDSCADCHATFSCDIPHGDQRPDDIYCPNCGSRLKRPPVPNQSIALPETI